MIELSVKHLLLELIQEEMKMLVFYKLFLYLCVYILLYSIEVRMFVINI